MRICAVSGERGRVVCSTYVVCVYCPFIQLLFRARRKYFVDKLSKKKPRSRLNSKYTKKTPHRRGAHSKPIIFLKSEINRILSWRWCYLTSSFFAQMAYQFTAHILHSCIFVQITHARAHNRVRPRAHQRISFKQVPCGSCCWCTLERHHHFSFFFRKEYTRVLVVNIPDAKPF